jgi:hypothetical protein
VNPIANPESSEQLRWKESLKEFLANPEEPIQITTLRRSLSSASRPAFARGIDKREYVIKGQQAGRQIINDQIVARLGKALNAPVAEPQIVEISPELLDCAFSYLTPGTAHGVVFITDCSDDREFIKYTHEPENRTRFALLSVLYGWVYAQDHQFIYTKKVPYQVFSVDHGHFFHGGPHWTMETLRSAPPASIDRFIHSKAKLKKDELETGLNALESVSEASIIRTIASVPTEWRITMEERIVLIEYLLRRQKELLSLYLDEG